jgi:hypothetical protein
MEGTKALAESIERDRIRRAQDMTAEAKLSAGIELFEFACNLSRAGIRHDFPNADDAEVERILAERLELGRKLEIGRWIPSR